MSNFSTLTYLVNNFQADLNSTSKKVVCSFSGDLFTEKNEKSFEPSKRSIDNILNFARSYEVLETETAGHVEMILN